MKIEFDADRLTIAEAQLFEEKTGLSIGTIKPGTVIPAVALRGLVFIIQRRTEPAFSWEDAGDVELTSLDFGTPQAADPFAGAAAED